MKGLFFSGIVLFCGFSVSSLAQIPQNTDSAKALYDSALAKVSGQKRPLMVFSFEEDGATIKDRKTRYGYIDGDGQKHDFTLNSKNELFSLPGTLTDSIALYYVDRRSKITSKQIGQAFYSKGGVVYFGRLHNFKVAARRFDEDDEYRSSLSNAHRGLYSVLSKDRVREAFHHAQGSKDLYYCVVQRGNVENISFYFH